MPLTTLDPHRALIIVDLRKGIVGLHAAPALNSVIEKASALAGAFRENGQTGSLPDGWTDLIPELNRRRGDIVVTKPSWGAFAGADLEARLKARGVIQAAIAGVATGTGVESTANEERL